MVNIKTSVIVTVLNEAHTVDRLITALRKQTLTPSEVLIVDGGSQDETFSRLLKLQKDWGVLRVFQQPGNRSVGRNFAVRQAKMQILAFTDAGCIPENNWLEELVKPFTSSQTNVVSGYYKGLPQNVFQKSLVPYVLVMPDQTEKSEFFPSTRSMAIRKSAWLKSGGFNEKLSHNEDYAFAMQLKKMGFSFTFVPTAIVGWIPRKNLKSAAWMFVRFAMGDIQAGILRPKVKLLAYRYLIFLFLLFLAFEIPALFFLIIPGVLLYLAWAVLKNYRYVNDVRGIFWLPVLQLTADVCVLFGSLEGYLSLVFLK